MHSKDGAVVERYMDVDGSLLYPSEDILYILRNNGKFAEIVSDISWLWLKLGWKNKVLIGVKHPEFLTGLRRCTSIH